MKPDWAFGLFCAFLVVVVLISMALLLPKEFKESADTAEYVNISDDIRRTDDLEKGVSCYRSNGGYLSCVLTKEK